MSVAVPVYQWSKVPQLGRASISSQTVLVRTGRVREAIVGKLLARQ
jgi:hypothetical protein